MGKKHAPLSPSIASEAKSEEKMKSPLAERGDPNDVPETTSPPAGLLSLIDESATQFTDVECLQTYSSLTSWQDFNNALPGVLQEKLVRGALRANGGALPCFKCYKSLSTSMGVIMHVKKCRKRAQKSLSEIPSGAATAIVTKAGDIVRPPAVPAKRKTVPKKGLNLSMTLSSLQDLQEEPSIWLGLPQEEKMNILKVFFPTKEIECFSIRAGSKKCPTFNDYKKAIAHLDSCIEPMYLTFVGQRASEFRSLDKKLRAKYVRDGMAMYQQLPCIECGRLFSHHYGLLYHVERCNVSDEEIPWKCYRCSFQTTRAKSHEHLRECWSTLGDVGRDSLSSCHVMGSLGDVNLRSGKALLKDTKETFEIDGVPKLVSEINAEDALKSILGPTRTINATRKRRSVGGNRASVSGGVIPQNSTRLTVSGDGKMRFKFRKADTKGGAAGIAGYPRYLEQVRESHERWCEEVSTLPYCARLSEIEASVWKTAPNSPRLPCSSKESVGVRLFEERDGDHTEVPVSCRRLKAFTTAEFTNEKNDTITVAYCGGPINAIRVAPNTMPSGEEVVAVVTYPCEVSLVGKDMRTADGLVQFWLHSSNGSSSNFVPWFVLKSSLGLVFDVCWLDRPRASPDDTLIGYFALATAHGIVLIYRLDTTTIPSKSSRSPGLPVVAPEPGLILEQPKSMFFNRPENYEPIFAPPIHTVTWSARGSAQYIVGVNAAGGAVIWDLQRSIDTPQVLLDSSWSSPVQAAAFVGAYDVALSFRERLIRVYDVRSYECSLEENAVRTAGCRVASQPRLFSGVFALQSEYFASGEIPSNGVSFICTETRSGGYFVVPLANRHFLMTWDVSACSSNAVVASCGVDGRLLLSANGRLVTAASTMDFGFCLLKSSLTLTRRRISEPETVNIATLFSKGEESFNESSTENDAPVRRACQSYATHEDTLQHLWLDISLNSDPQACRNRLEHSALDLRVESLNCVATNNSPRAFVFTGGQAGLIFIRPCVIDTELSILNDLFQGSPSDASAKRSKSKSSAAL